LILVDTSVFVDKLRKNQNEKTALLDKIIESDVPFGLSLFTYHEILQGAISEKEFIKMEKYFSTQNIIMLPNNLQVYKKSSKLYFDLRRQGITIRNTVDVMIAYTAIYNKIPLLHNDRDFDFIAKGTTDLKILNSL
jgi:predicted nucleic acid-binding protein